MSDMLPAKKPAQDPTIVASYGTAGGFDLMQRQAQALAASQLIPKHFQGKVPDCIIALEMANRIGASAFAVLQNLYIVHGSPAWSAKFLIACVNACGRFSPLRYKQTGNKDDDSWGVIAWAKDLADGEVLESPEVTIAIAKAEGWFSKSGSKWQTIPELMLRYRAATFFARTYAPDLTMGIVTNDEAYDIAEDVEVTESPINEKEHAATAIAEVPDLGDEGGKEKEKVVDAPDDAILTPVEKLSKSACVAEMKLYQGAPYFNAILDEELGAGVEATSCAVSALRGVVTALREADAGL